MTIVKTTKFKILTLATLVLIAIVFIFYFFPPHFANDEKQKFCHVSIDDVSECLTNLEQKQYSSAFEEPFFARLKQLHEDYGCKFTLYCFLMPEGHIYKLGDRYYQDFSKNNSWLKFAYHGIQGQSHAPYNVDVDSFKQYVHQFDSLTINSLGGASSLASIERLDYFYAKPEELSFLHQQGIKVLLSADDDRKSYGLSLKKNKHLLASNSVESNGIKILRTNIRVELTDIPYYHLMRNRDRDTLVIFTHEWQKSRFNRYKFNRYMKLLSQNNYKFLCE